MTRDQWLAAARSFWVKHKFSIIDLGALAAAMGVVAYVAYSVDIFANEANVSAKALTFELDELMLLGALLMFGLLIFAIRRYVGQKREMSRRISAEHRARELAYQDPLTGLANRRQFSEALDVALKSPAGSDAVHALFMCDLNGFKQVNDIHGHGVGDELLIVVAQRLQQVVRANDLVARLGGDEFAILAQHLMGPEAAATLAQRIISAVGEPIVIGNVRHSIGIGIGISLLSGETTVESLRKADLALYRAKAERRPAFRFFAEEMDRLIRERDALERQLRDAVSSSSVATSYQPSIELRTGRIVGFEATPRWMDGDGHEIPALRFIPIAEETGLIHALAEQMLRSACTAAASWPAEVRLSVDIYRGQLTDASLAARILRVLEETGVDPHRLELEIPESVLVDNLPGVQQAFGALREAGIRIALDHFGTGYSTLYHLRQFKIDRVKIDRSFVGDDPDSLKMLSALAGLGRGLGLEVAADGIDSLGNGVDMLGAGIQQAQGGMFGPALSESEALRMIDAAETLPQARVS
jgi:diguanylate cyclase (GGDEF)-like protein